MVEFLLQCGFSVTIRNNEGKTAMHTASVKVTIITIIKNNKDKAALHNTFVNMTMKRMKCEC